MASNQQIEPPKIDQYQTLRDLLIGSGLYDSRMVAGIKDQEVKRCAGEYLRDLRKSVDEDLPSRFTEAGKDRELTPEVERRMINLYNLNFGRFYLLQFCDTCEDLEAVTPHIRKWLYKDFVERGNDPDHVKRLSEFLARLDESPEARARYIEQFTPIPGKKRTSFSALMGQKKYLDELVDVMEDTPEARVEAKRKQGTSAGLTNMKRSYSVITEGEKSLLQSETLVQQGAGLFDLIYYGDFRRPDGVDLVNNTATFCINGAKMQFQDYDRFIGGTKTWPGLPVIELKVLDIATSLLIGQNCFQAHNPNCEVTFSLTELAKRQRQNIEPKLMDNPTDQKKENENAKKRLKLFRGEVEKALDQLERISLHGTVKQGGKKFNLTLRVISSHAVEKNGDKIVIYFDQAAATYLCASHRAGYDMNMQALDSQTGSYRVAKKIMEHYTMETNYHKGTDEALSVESLVKAVPGIPSFETVAGWQNKSLWKPRIKRKLEEALNKCVDGGIIEFWHYEDRNHKAYTPEEAGTLRQEEYQRLIVHYIVPKHQAFFDKMDEWDRKALEEQNRKKKSSPKSGGGAKKEQKS